MDQHLHFEYIPATGEILFHAHYPGGHDHSTRIFPDELDELIANARNALKKYRA